MKNSKIKSKFTVILLVTAILLGAPHKSRAAVGGGSMLLPAALAEPALVWAGLGLSVLGGVPVVWSEFIDTSHEPNYGLMIYGPLLMLGIILLDESESKVHFQFTQINDTKGKMLGLTPSELNTYNAYTDHLSAVLDSMERELGSSKDAADSWNVLLFNNIDSIDARNLRSALAKIIAQ